MTGLWITAGITLKVIYLLIFRSAKPESVLIFGPVIIPLLVGIGVLIIGELLFGPPGGEVLLPWGAIAAYYAIWVFMFFKDSLLPYITEGTLFSYGLVGCYIFSLMHIHYPMRPLAHP